MSEITTKGDAMEALDRLRGRMAGMARKADSAGKEVQRKVVMGATGYVIGKMDMGAGSAGGIQPLRIAGLPTDISVAIVGYGAELFAGGRIGEVGGAVADAALTIAAYRMGRGA